MSIRDELHDELKDAMRAPDRNRIDVVRQIKTEIGRAVTAPGFKGEADDELYRKTIAAYAKKMGKALARVRELRGSRCRGGGEAAVRGRVSRTMAAEGTLDGGGRGDGRRDRSERGTRRTWNQEHPKEQYADDRAQNFTRDCNAVLDRLLPTVPEPVATPAPEDADSSHKTGAARRSTRRRQVKRQTAKRRK